MARSRQLPSGIVLVDGVYRLDFTFDSKRYRLRTIYETCDNIDHVVRLKNKLVKALRDGRFSPSLFLAEIPTINAVIGINNKYNMTDLLLSQIEKYRVRQDLTLASFINLQKVIELHLMPYFADIDIVTITIDDIEDFIKSLHYSRDRIRLIIRPLRLIFKTAQRDGIIQYNPFDLFDNSILNSHAINTEYEVKPFSTDEISQILSCCEHDCIRNIIQVGFYTGLRIGELFALTWNDINFIDEQIHVDKTVSIRGIIKSPKTKAGNRTVEMLTEAKEALQRQFDITSKSDDKRVFKSPKGANWNKSDNLGRYWRRAIIKACVEYRNPYQMRHTFISQMLQRGNSPIVLYRMVGHENPEIMYKHYARFINMKGKKLLI